MPNLNDPSSLTDEELDRIIAGEELEEDAPEEVEDKPEVVEETEDKPEVEEKPKDDEEEEVEEPVKPTDDKPEEEEEEDAKPPSRRESLRIQSLLEKMKSQPKEPARPTPTDKQLDYAAELDADPELISRLEADRKAARDESYDNAMKQIQASEWRTTLNIDAPQIESKFAILNPNDKENFHPTVASTLTDMYLSQVGFDPETKTVKNPGIRWSDYVEAQMELAEEIAASLVAKTTTNVKRQVAQTATRPDGGSATKSLNFQKSPDSMTDEELDAMIAQAIPSR